MLGDGYDYERSGVVYKGALDGMMHDNAAGAWIKKPGFESAGIDWNKQQRRIAPASPHGTSPARDCSKLHATCRKVRRHVDAEGDRHGRVRILGRLPLRVFA